MARINGINSDYKLLGGEIQQVPPVPGNLDLKLFLCPYGEKNGLEAEAGVCVGTDTACPHVGAKTGHTLLHFSEAEGIRLKTDGGTELRVHQGAAPDPNPGCITLSPKTGTGKLRVTAPMELSAAGQVLTVTPAAAGVTFQHTNGARIVFKANGDLEIVTLNNSGNVTIQGNLVVSGTVTRQGQII